MGTREQRARGRWPVRAAIVPRNGAWGPALCGWLVAVGVCTGEPASVSAGPVAKPVHTVVSASRNFLVSGVDPRANADMARWAEETALRVERFVGMPLPAPPGATVTIELLEAPQRLASVTSSTAWANGLIRGFLVVRRGEQVNPEAVQEALCGLLLESLVLSLEPVARRGVRGRRVPAWWVAGVAQNLTAGQRERNGKLVTGLARCRATPGFAELLGWQELPEKAAGMRAHCGLAAAWVSSANMSPDAGRRMVLQWVRGDRISAQWLATNVVHAASLLELESGWQEWLARQARLVRNLGEASTDLLEQLKALLPVAWEEDGVVRRVGPGDLAPMAGDGKVRAAAGRQAEALRVVALGKAPEFVEVAEAYRRFFDGVRRGAWSRTLRKELGKADEMLARFEGLTRAREACLDEVERAQGAGPEVVGEETWRLPWLEKTPLEVYVDGVEESLVGMPAGRR